MDSFISLLAKQQADLLASFEAEVRQGYEAKLSVLREKRERIQSALQQKKKRLSLESESKIEFMQSKTKTAAKLSLKKWLMLELVTDTLISYLAEEKHHEQWLAMAWNDIANTDGDVTVAPASAPLLRSLKQPPKKITISEDIGPYGFVFENESVRVENTIESLVEVTYPLLEPELDRLLFSSSEKSKK
jgi:hypothetical protein